MTSNESKTKLLEKASFTCLKQLSSILKIISIWEDNEETTLSVHNYPAINFK